MKVSTLLIAAAVSAVFASTAFAQKSDVNLKNAKQVQSGALNKQKADIGNATGKGSKSKVRASNIKQTQSGALNKQTLKIGNAANGCMAIFRANNI